MDTSNSVTLNEVLDLDINNSQDPINNTNDISKGSKQEEKTEFVETTEQWRLAFSILFSTMTVRTLIYVVAIFLPLYVDQKHDTLTSAQVGLMIGAVTLTNAILCIPTGFLLFYISHKTLALVGQAIIVIACFIFAATTWIKDDATFFYVGYISRLSIGIGSAIYNVASLAILTIEFEEIRSKVLFDYIKWEGFGILFGPIFGGCLYIPVGFGGTVFGVAIMNLVAFTMSVCWLPARVHQFREIEKQRAEERRAANGIQGIDNQEDQKAASVGFSTFLTNKRSLNGLMATAAGVLMATFLDGILSVELDERGQPLYLITLAFMSTTVFYIISIKTIGLYVHKIGARRMCMVGLVLYWASLSLLGPSDLFHYPSDATWMIYLGMCIHGVAFALVSVSNMPEIYYGAEMKVLSVRERLGLQEDPQTKIDINSVGATLLLTFKCCGVAFAPFLGGMFADNNGYTSACDNMLIIAISYSIAYFFVTFVFCTSQNENFRHDSYGLNKEDLALKHGNAAAGKGDNENDPLIIKK